MINKEFTLLEKVKLAREHQKEFNARMKAKGIDTTWKGYINKKKAINFVPMNSYKNSKSAWLEEYI